MMESTIGWRNTNEDNLSTGSCSSSEHEMNSTQASRNAERRLLRVPNVRRVVPVPKNPKAVITTLSLLSLTIVSVVFGSLYLFGGNYTQTEIDKRKSPSSDHDIFVRDLEDLKSSQHSDLDHESDEEMLSDMPAASESSSKLNSNSTKIKRKKRVRHGPRQLPRNATEKQPFSLLFQLKLLHGKRDSLVNFTKCEDVDRDQNKFYKGWKAVIPVNLMAAGFNPNDKNNTFVGYGKTKTDASTRAAQHALTTLYPTQLKYDGMDDFAEIEEFCSNPKGQLEVQDITANMKNQSSTLPQTEHKSDEGNKMKSIKVTEETK